MMRDRNALEVCLLGVFAASVAPSAFYIADLPPSLRSVPVLGHAVAIVLLVGCVGSIAGIAINDLDRSLLTEQFFLAVTGLGFFGYGGALIRGAYLRASEVPPDMRFAPYADSAYVIGLCLGIGAFTIWRFVQIQRYVKRRKLLGERITRRDQR